MAYCFTYKIQHHAEKKQIDLSRRSVFVTSSPAFDEALALMRDRMELGGYASSTIISYVRAVRDLMEHCQRTPQQCSEAEIIAYLNHIRSVRRISPSALNCHVFGIYFYFREVLKDRGISISIPNPGRSKAIGDILTETEVRALLAACHYPKQRAVLHLLYDAGLRAREVAQLRLGDFDKKNGILYVRFGKGDKHRVVPYGRAVREVLVAYFHQARPSDWLFEGNTQGEPISVKAVHPHVLRHTFAVHYLNNGGSIVRLQQLLGHGHLSTTLIYLRYAAIPLRDIPTPLDCLTGQSNG